MKDQLAMPFPVPPRRNLDDFFPGPNEEVLAVVRRAAQARSALVVYLHGPAGTGRSHLLQGAASLARLDGRDSAYLPVGQPGIGREMLAGIDAGGLACLDDLERLGGDADLERAVLDLFERCRQSGGSLLAAAAGPPAAIGIRLPDLVSRPAGSLVYRLRPLSDPERAEALRWEARRRGLELAPATVEWLMRRVPRETGALFALLDRIDKSSLEEGRRVTIPFLRGMGIG
ncbi:MAG: DnaA regulatory inactivator Hda [Gammaproteobacteria bacterium]|nr:DnaA regulatory inactivator Hda [Gammaproteobacteria bacterium]